MDLEDNQEKDYRKKILEEENSVTDCYMKIVRGLAKLKNFQTGLDETKKVLDPEVGSSFKKFNNVKEKLSGHSNKLNSREFSLFVYLLNSLTVPELLEAMVDFLRPFDPEMNFVFDEQTFSTMVESWSGQFGEELMCKFFETVDRNTFHRYQHLDNLFTESLSFQNHFGPFIKGRFFFFFKAKGLACFEGDRIGEYIDFWKFFPYVTILMFESLYTKIQGRRQAYRVTLGLSENGKRLPISEGSLYSILSSFDNFSRSQKVTLEKMEKVLILYRTMHSEEITEMQLQLIIKDMRTRFEKIEKEDEIDPDSNNEDNSSNEGRDQVDKGPLNLESDDDDEDDDQEDEEESQNGIPFREILDWVTLQLCIHIHINKEAHEIDETLSSDEYKEPQNSGYGGPSPLNKNVPSSSRKRRFKIRLVLESLLWHSASLKNFNSWRVQVQANSIVEKYRNMFQDGTMKTDSFVKLISEVCQEIVPHMAQEQLIHIFRVFMEVNSFNANDDFCIDDAHLFCSQLFAILVVRALKQMRNFVNKVRSMFFGTVGNHKKQSLMQGMRDKALQRVKNKMKTINNMKKLNRDPKYDYSNPAGKKKDFLRLHLILKELLSRFSLIVTQNRAKNRTLEEEGTSKKLSIAQSISIEGKVPQKRQQGDSRKSAAFMTNSQLDQQQAEKETQLLFDSINQEGVDYNTPRKRKPDLDEGQSPPSPGSVANNQRRPLPSNQKEVAFDIKINPPKPSGVLEEAPLSSSSSEGARGPPKMPIHHDTFKDASRRKEGAGLPVHILKPTLPPKERSTHTKGDPNKKKKGPLQDENLNTLEGDDKCTLMQSE